MSEAVYEFPLKEKVRNYLRIEILLKNLKHASNLETQESHVYFFEQLFTLLDLFERLDVRTDLIKDFDVHERNLVHWSQLPNINNTALEQTLRQIVRLRDTFKTIKKFGSDLKDDKFLLSIRQRFAIPGATCSFDLPNLHFWLQQPIETKQKQLSLWFSAFVLLEEAVSIVLSFLRAGGKFAQTVAPKGFYQGVAEDKNELIRITCDTDKGYYPTLSGNKYRYALRFMWFSPEEGQSASVDQDVTFRLAAC